MKALQLLFLLSCVALTAHGLHAALHEGTRASELPFVLNVGAPRMSTQTMYKAFQILGLNPLHTGYDHKPRKAWYNYLFENGSLAEALETLKGHHAAMDEPMQLVYKEVMKAYPNAKFVLTQHETPQDWYRSYNKFYSDFLCMNRTISGLEESVMEDLQLSPEAVGSPVYNRSDTKRNAVSYWNCRIGDTTHQTAEMVNGCLAMYNAHIAAVKRDIPPEKLLIFDTEDGWEPLVKFLGLPEPEEEPFPEIDELNMKELPSHWCPKRSWIMNNATEQGKDEA